MSKTKPAKRNPDRAEPEAVPHDSAAQSGIDDADPADPITSTSFWLLKEAAAKKLGKRAEGDIHYRVLADADRSHLYIAITGNESGGYFSREMVDLDMIRACLTQGKAFPSKALREAFIGRSSNNAGFMAAILRTENLLGADPDTETLHRMTGDWSAWEQQTLALPGTLLEIDVIPAQSQEGEEVKEEAEEGDAMEEAEHTEMPALSAPSGKGRRPAKHTMEDSHAGDSPDL